MSLGTTEASARPVVAVVEAEDSLVFFFVTSTVSGGESVAHMQRKIWAAADFQYSSLDQIRVDHEKQVRKRRTSMYRSSPADAVEHFLVSLSSLSSNL